MSTAKYEDAGIKWLEFGIEYSTGKIIESDGSTEAGKLLEGMVVRRIFRTYI